MKRKTTAVGTIVVIAILLAGCGPSVPSDKDVLNAYEARMASRQNSGESALSLPDTAVVDGCKCTPSPIMDEGYFFTCYIKMGGKDDPDKNLVRLHRTLGGWSMSD
jgi:hypothetical protein